MYGRYIHCNIQYDICVSIYLASFSESRSLSGVRPGQKTTLIPAPSRTRVLISQLDFSSLTTRIRLPQQASTGDPMSTPTRLPLGTQRTPTNEQHCPASNNSTLNEGRIGIQIASASAMPPSSYSTASPADLNTAPRARPPSQSRHCRS
jgi:hypothetical protein